MGKINVQGVLVGGLLAGVVLNVVDYLMYGVVLADDFRAAMQALGVTGEPPIVLFIVLDFLYGITLIYLYAAIRPRFGPGPKTAVYAGLIMWVIAGLLHMIGEAPMGFFPQKLYLIGTVVFLVIAPVAAVVGAKYYTETP